MSFRRIAILAKRVSLRTLLASFLCLVAGTSTFAYDQLNLTQIYTRDELAAYQNSQLIDLIVARQDAFGVPSSPVVTKNHSARTLTMIGGALGAAGLIFLATSIRSHANASNLEMPTAGLASNSRRSVLSASSTICNPATRLFCIGNVTQTACNETSLFGSAASSALTIYAGNNASANTSATPIVTQSSHDETNNTFTEQIVVPAVTKNDPKDASPTSVPVIPTTQSGGGSTSTYLSAGSNFLLGSLNLLLGCNNQNNLSTSNTGATTGGSSVSRR